MIDKDQKIALIAIGNPYRSDDGVGFEIVRDLKKQRIENLQVFEASGEGAGLIEIMEDKASVFMFDAVRSGAAPGTIFRFEAHNEPVPMKFFNYSTHDFSVAEAIELARVMNRLPPRLIVYGIEGRNFENGIGLTRELQQACPEVIENVLADIAKMRN